MQPLEARLIVPKSEPLIYHSRDTLAIDPVGVLTRQRESGTDDILTAAPLVN
jgi:hypothetical protein